MTDTTLAPGTATAARRGAAATSGTTGPLAGIRIIDLSAVISGPFATAMLGDQGADVIVVEQPHAPDIIRNSGPLDPGSEGVSALYASMNRNKRSISLNLKTEDGRRILKDLVRTADVLVQNFRPGAMDRLGIGWDVLSALNPDLIMCSISGFGADGPYSHRPAFDPIIQSVAGYPTVQSDGDGTPHLVATAVCDKVTSMHVAQSICAALVARANGAGGQHIELAMVDASIHFLWPETMWHYTYRDFESDMPNLTDIYKLYESSDGWVMIYPVALESHWRSMCTALGRADLAADPRFADLQGRVRYGNDINDELQAETRRFTTAELVEMMDRADVPVAPVNTRQTMIDDPHVQHRGMVTETVHPSAGRIRQARPPALFSKTPSSLHRPAPRFAEHTDEVLAEVLGLSERDLAVLHADGAIR
jgi:crotonobetainyl-CoA:carnitine CoA-transferase CaiB-like acyl-CoA transferase